MLRAKTTINNSDLKLENYSRERLKHYQGGYKGKFKLRVYQHRVIFQIKEGELLITIIRVWHRKEAY